MFKSHNLIYSFNHVNRLISNINLGTKLSKTNNVPWKLYIEQKLRIRIYQFYFWK